MRRAVALIIFLGAATLTLGAQTPSPSTATIRGRVLTAGTGIPVRKARVTLAPDAGASVDPVYSDNDGRFVFSAVTPRHYILTAWKAGYAAAAFGAHGFWDRAVT